jgi:cytochrome o ubiquinol oxidase subunit IV
MSKSAKPIVSKHEPGHGSLLSYSLGFASSIVLTLLAFELVKLYLDERLHLSRNGLIAGVIGLAFVQFLIQAVCFLHLGRETRPRWKLLVFIFMISVVFILVAGSLWIMNNLNYHMTGHQMEKYLQSQDGL